MIGTALTEEQECTVGPDGVSQVCVPTSVDDKDASALLSEDDCTDRMGTAKCQARLPYGSQDNTRTTTCIEQFPLMRTQCARTCALCHTLTVEQLDGGAVERYALPRLYATDAAQIVEGPHAAETYRYLQDVDAYMYDTVYDDDEFAKVRTSCQNQHELCTFWAMRK